MRCLTCENENPAEAKFCGECGTRLERRCLSCASANPPANKFCYECGHDLATPAALPSHLAAPQAYTPRHLADKILSTRRALEGERKQVTVLFCDLVSSTPLAERLGPEAMHSLLSRFFELALGEVHRYEGTVNKFLGDGFMALFGVPLAHEDHARRAVLAALGIQRRLAEQAAELVADGLHAAPAPGSPQDARPADSAEPLQVRMGLNTGLVVVGSIGDDLEMDYTAIGDTTNVAARLQALAEPHTILISDATARLVRGYVRTQELGPTMLKGKREPVAVYRVAGLGPRRSPLDGLEERALSPFVGRARELAVLHELWGQVEGGHGQVVGLVAEPGMGKSRLLMEFRRSLAGEPVNYLEGRCLSYGSAIPYLPLLDIIRSNCGILDTDAPETVAGKVRFALQEVGLDPDESAPYLLQLLGVKDGLERLSTLSPEAVKARTFETLRQMSLRGSRQRPLILAVEDLHWLDKTSEDFFASLVESLAGAPLLLLCTYRPGYRPPWMDRSYATQISLQRLLPDDSLRVVGSVLRAERVPEPLVQVILGKAEGNPFFLEELARAVVEHGGLRAGLPVPDTVQGVLMARIDRLADEPRRVLQTASVLGREFSLRLLSAIWDGPGVLDPHLLELKRLEFVYEQTGSEEPTYVFKHALTQDVAYESLLLARRQALHAAAGNALEVLFAGRLEDVYDRLGYHFSRTEQAAKAVEYLARFADKVARSYAHEEAARALREALRHVGRLPVEEQERRLLDLILRLAHSLYFLGGFQETLELLLDHQSRVERLQDPALAGPYYFWLAHTYSYRGEHELAARSARCALEAGSLSGDEAVLGKAHYILAREGMWTCQFQQGIAEGQQAVTLLERTDERLWLGQSHWVVGLNYYLLGAFEEALASEARTRAVGEAIADPRLPTYAAWSSGLILATRGDWEEGIAECQRALAHSRDAVNTAAALGFLGLAHVERGDPAQAIPLLEQSVRQWAQWRYRPLQGWMTASLAEAHLLSGDVEKAREVANEAIDVSREAAFSYAAGLAQRVLGRIAWAKGARAEAATHLGDALTAFASIQARFELGRTQLALAEIAHAEGKPETAAAPLNEARRLFRELGVPRCVERAERLAGEIGIHTAE